MAFWQTKTLSEMNKDEWESLCDGCAKCCLKKLQNIDTDEVFYTSVACNLLDLESCRCTDYLNRNQKVPECIWLTFKDTQNLKWLPKTCAYRLLAENKDLPSWHPLVSKDKNSVFESGVGIKSYAVQNIKDKNLEDFIIGGL